MKSEQCSRRVGRRNRHRVRSTALAALAALALFAAVGTYAHTVSDAVAPLRIAQSAVTQSAPQGQQAQRQGIVALIHADYFAQGHSAQALVIHEDAGRDTAVRF